MDGLSQTKSSAHVDSVTGRVDWLGYCCVKSLQHSITRRSTSRLNDWTRQHSTSFHIRHEVQIHHQTLCSATR